MPARRQSQSLVGAAPSSRSKKGYRQVAATDGVAGEGDGYGDVQGTEKHVLHIDSADSNDEADYDDEDGKQAGGARRRDEETRGFLTASGQPASGTYLPPDADGHHRPGDDAPRWLSRRTFRTFVVAFLTCLIVVIGFKFVADNSGLSLMLPSTAAAKEAAGSGSGDKCACKSTASVPLHFQTSPQVFAGPTATGNPAFLAQTVTINPSATYVANQPLQTNIDVVGMAPGDGNIFQNMGYLSPYNPSPGFGVQEYPLPPGADIVQVQMLSRHGSRYPTLGANVYDLGQKLAEAKGKFKATGGLEFLQDWEYRLGHEILVPKGRQELFDSGILHSYMYSHLYNPNSKLIVRTTTQDRMLKSAENFMAGFFGLEWTNNATIEVIIEQANFNNSLAGYLNCPNSEQDNSGTEAAKIWVENYLRNATARLASLVDGIDWTIEDTYAAQTMCPYETAAYGFSRFCNLFTYEEWQAFGYSIDLAFAGNNGFQSSTGRAVGIGYQQEVIARIKNHTLGYSGSQINITLDNNTDTFPLNQSLYFDFSHDTNIVSILTAFGFQQFASLLQPSSHPGTHNFTVSHIVPFGARFDVEIIRAPHPVKADRTGYATEAGGETKYIHFILNQRTLPLGASFAECDASRLDGWCELDTFLRVQEEMEQRAKYDKACHGPFTPRPYGMIMDGAPM